MAETTQSLMGQSQTRFKVESGLELTKLDSVDGLKEESKEPAK